MRVMIFEKPGKDLSLREMDLPEPGAEQVLLRVHACAVCRTDLHIIDGELSDPKTPLVPGHEIVGTVAAVGAAVTRFKIGDRLGVPWLGWTCGECSFCREGQENLCDRAKFTGYTLDGGYAEYAVADQRFCFPIPEEYSEAQQFALSLGAVWAGSSDELPPVKLDAAIIFAPVGALITQALKAVRKGGTVVSGGIHMSDIPSFPYALLWEERSICSVANLTRRDGAEFMQLAPKVPVRTQVETFALAEANEALQRLRSGRIHGAAVLVVK